ncbi:hypothetical protein ACFU7Y_18335 [Kitasatospora sp. NPDC057542]|uniref:hypothetical protein n=1 Tax=Kitasatospora sp. NPDC057542 TaxID=3346162 RepID=UPI0036B29D77
MSRLEQICQAIEDCEGYSIDALSMAVLNEEDALEISLRRGPEKRDLSISLKGVVYFEIGRDSHASAGPLCELRASVIGPGGDSWPEGINFDRVRQWDARLIWLRASGPVQLNVLANTAVVLQELE